MNGGRSASYEAQLGQSIFSAIILLILLGLFWKLSSPKPGSNKHIIFQIMTVLWVIGLIGQLAGTEFERYVMSVALLIGVISHARLANIFSAKPK